MAQVIYLPLTPLVGSPPSGTTAVHFDAAGLGLAPAALAVKVTLVSPAAAITNAAGTVIARGGTATLDGSGHLDVALEQNALLSDPASTYTIQVGDSIFSGLVVPPSGPVNLADLVAATTDRTVVVTATIGGPDQGPDANLVAGARLSIDCTDLDGALRLARTEVQATSDTGGLLTWRLERTDQLTPVAGAGEPYYTFRIGDSVFYRHVRAGGGVVPALPLALPTVGDGSVGVPVFGASGAGHSVGLVPDPGASAGILRFLREDASFAAAAASAAAVTYTASATLDHGYTLVLLNANSASLTLTLPNDALEYGPLLVKRTDTNLAHTVTIVAAAGGSLNNSSGGTLTLIDRKVDGYVLTGHAGAWYASESGTAKLNNTNVGELYITGLFNAQLDTFLQHLSGNVFASSPVVTAGAAAGTAPGTPAKIFCTDVQGRITLTVGTATSTGVLLTVTLHLPAFSSSFLSVLVQGGDAASQALLPYGVEHTDGTAVDICVAVAPTASTAYVFKYLIAAST